MSPTWTSPVGQDDAELSAADRLTQAHPCLPVGASPGLAWTLGTRDLSFAGRRERSARPPRRVSEKGGRRREAVRLAALAARDGSCARPPATARGRRRRSWSCTRGRPREAQSARDPERGRRRARCGSCGGAQSPPDSKCGEFAS